MSSELQQQAIALLRTGKRDEARELLKQVIKGNPANEEAWILFAETLPNDAERIKALKQCLTINPNSSMARQELARLTAKKPQPESQKSPKKADNKKSEAKRAVSHIPQDILSSGGGRPSLISVLLFVLGVLSLFLSGTALLITQLRAGESSQPEPITTPVVVTYDYQYEIISTYAECEPDSETVSDWSFGSEAGHIDKAAAEIAAVNECSWRVFNNYISNRGNQGWKLIAFESMGPEFYSVYSVVSGETKFPVEYSYRLVWERPY